MKSSGFLLFALKSLEVIETAPSGYFALELFKLIEAHASCVCPIDDVYDMGWVLMLVCEWRKGGRTHMYRIFHQSVLGGIRLCWLLSGPVQGVPGLVL